MTERGLPNINYEDILWGAYYIHEKRSKKAKVVDEALTARETDNPYLWASDPSRYDFDHIDTKDHHKPAGYSNRKGKKYAGILEKYK